MRTTVVDPLWTTEEVSTYLTVPVPTIYRWRVQGVGPRAIRVGKHLRFRRSEVERWVEEHEDRNDSA